MIRSEESITLDDTLPSPLITCNRSFTFVQDDVLPLVTFLSADKKGASVAAGENAFLFHRTILCLSFSIQRGMYGTMEKIPFIS